MQEDGDQNKMIKFEKRGLITCGPSLLCLCKNKKLVNQTHLGPVHLKITSQLAY